MSKIFFSVFFILLFTVTCFAQSNYTESLTITTYYPSPYGVYRNLRLHPSEEPQGPAVQPGVIYFNRTTEEVLIYKNSTKTFVPLCGDASSGEPLIYSVHTKSDCTKHAPAGRVVDTDTGFKQCQFDLPSCPTGWTQYKDYRTLPYGQAWSDAYCRGVLSCSAAQPYTWGSGNICSYFPALAWGNNPLRSQQFQMCCAYASGHEFDPYYCTSEFHQPFSEKDGQSPTQVGCY